MPLPNPATIRVDPLLTEYAIAYSQPDSAFVGDVAATLTRVQERGGKYPVWDKADFFRDEFQAVTNNQPAPRAEFRGALEDFYVGTLALKTFLSDKDRNEANPLLDDQAQVRFLAHKAKIKRERMFADVAFKTGVWTANTEQTGKSSGPSTNEFLQFRDAQSEPLRIIREQLDVVQYNTGIRPNTMTTNQAVIDALCDHPSILERFQYTVGGNVSLDQLKTVLGLKNIFVSSSVYAANKEGSATPGMTKIFGDHILLHYVAPAWNKDTPTSVAGFSWTPWDKATATSFTVKKWREEDPDGDWFRADMAITYKIVANDLGVFLKDAVL